jgi:hypothetical protein
MRFGLPTANTATDNNQLVDLMVDHARNLKAVEATTEELNRPTIVEPVFSNRPFRSKRFSDFPQSQCWCRSRARSSLRNRRPRAVPIWDPKTRGVMTPYMVVGRARLAACLATGGGRACLLAPVASYSRNRARPVDGCAPVQSRAQGASSVQDQTRVKQQTMTRCSPCPADHLRTADCAPHFGWCPALLVNPLPISTRQAVETEPPPAVTGSAGHMSALYPAPRYGLAALVNDLDERALLAVYGEPDRTEPVRELLAVSRAASSVGRSSPRGS